MHYASIEKSNVSTTSFTGQLIHPYSLFLRNPLPLFLSGHISLKRNNININTSSCNLYATNPQLGQFATDSHGPHKRFAFMVKCNQFMTLVFVSSARIIPDILPSQWQQLTVTYYVINLRLAFHLYQYGYAVGSVLNHQVGSLIGSNLQMLQRLIELTDGVAKPGYTCLREHHVNTHYPRITLTCSNKKGVCHASIMARPDICSS